MENLKSLEENIESGLRSGAEVVLAVGHSLAEIRDRKLYKDAGYRSFSKYLEESFSMTRARAYHLISAARVIDDLRSHFKESELPQNESVVRPLMKFEQDQLVEIWKAVLDAYKEPRREDVLGIVAAWSA